MAINISTPREAQVSKRSYVQQFFTLEAGERSRLSAEFRLRLHADAPVFAVHFPDYPVLPGVLTLKMVIDALNASRFFSPQTLTLTSVSNAKYLAVINPQEVSMLTVNVSLKSSQETSGSSPAVMAFKASVTAGEKNFATFSFSCIPTDVVETGVEENEVCAVIPTYNNAQTLLQVIAGVHQVVRTVLVVNDGSTDDTASRLAEAQNEERPDELICHAHNLGKGAALHSGLLRARAMGFRYAVTVDADGQHRATDIPALLQAVAACPDSLVVGSRELTHNNMPAKSTFANRFSNFWFALQTLHRLPDTQSGLRVYPLRRLRGLRFMSARYEAELALLVFSAWAGVNIQSVPVSVYYPPRHLRVSHFRPARDFARISVLNTLLCFLAIVYGWPRMLCRQLSRFARLFGQANAVSVSK